MKLRLDALVLVLIAALFISGCSEEKKYSMRIWLDPDRVMSLGLSPNAVISAIQSQNWQAVLGRLGAASTFISTMLVPVIYVLLETLREKFVSVEEEVRNREMI